MQTDLTLHLLPLRTGAGEAPTGMGIGCRLAVVAQVQRVLRILAGCVNLARAVSANHAMSFGHSTHSAPYHLILAHSIKSLVMSKI